VSTNGERKVAKSSLPYIQITENQSSLSEEANPPTGAASLLIDEAVALFLSIVILLTEINEKDSVMAATTRMEVIIFVFIRV